MEKTINRFSNNGISFDDDLIITGYACHWNVKNKNNEIVDANSFDYWLKELNNGAQRPMMTFNHDDNCIIGAWDDFDCDDTGLWVVGHINSDVAFCKDTIIPLVRHGDLNSLSTQGWSDRKTNELRDGGVYIKDFILTAISIVGLPADFDAKFRIVNGLVVPKTSKWYLL